MKTRYAIAPDAFVREMSSHWVNRLGNVVTDPLRRAWHQMGEAFGQGIEAHKFDDERSEWTVLQLSTGVGKSQGTAVYCSMLSQLANDEHPGVLIVIRRIDDVDAMVTTINTLSGRENYAKAYHSQVKGPGVLTMLCNYPVLVVTHRAYEMALDTLGEDGSLQHTWPNFQSWGVTGRRLVVVDEALDIVEEHCGELEGMRQTLAAIPDSVRCEYPQEVAAVKAFIEMLEKISGYETSSLVTREAMLLKDPIQAGSPPDFTELRGALRRIRFDQQARRQDEALQKSMLDVHDRRLMSIHALIRSWVYYAKQPRLGHTLNTARMVVPEGVKGAVVLDATATCNVIYDAFERATVLAPPVGVRSYKNVTLHVSRGHKTGKVALRTEGKPLIDALFAELNTRIKGRSALVVTHKDVEPLVVAQVAAFKVATSHWGAVTGSNDWRDCDVAVICGLPYRPTTWAANTFMALQGPQDTEWLRSQRRPFGRYVDVRSALVNGQVVSDVVQAINRIRCRRVIDAHGNCPAAEVFLLLPNGPTGDDILDQIQCQMPGVMVLDWNLKGTPSSAKKRGGARSDKTANLVAAAVMYLNALPPGRITKAELSTAVGLTKAAWDKLVAGASDSQSELYQDLHTHGVYYMREGSGRAQRSWFSKDR